MNLKGSKGLFEESTFRVYWEQVGSVVMACALASMGPNPHPFSSCLAAP